MTAPIESRPSTYQDMLQSIEVTQYAKGDCGCFAELFATMRGMVGQLMLMAEWGLIDEETFHSDLISMQGVLDRLPADVQTPESLVEAYEALNNMPPFFLSSVHDNPGG